MPLTPVITLAIGALLTLGLVIFAFAGPSPQRVAARRLDTVRQRHTAAQGDLVEAQLRRITGRGATKADRAAMRFLPRPEELQKRLNMTGKPWTVGRYGGVTLGIFVAATLLLLFIGFPLLLALLLGLAAGGGIPHFAVSYVIGRRVKAFNAKFPDAIELLVRGLRSGLPITETMAVVGSEVSGPVGEEFRTVADKMKIGRSMDVALQETADRLGTAEFQFFVITIAIQRETGGNLAETLQNLATVLRLRGQMKLKIRAMSSESKASAMIIGALPFIVFGLIWFVNSSYMQNFFVDERLMVAGVGGLIWMSIGAFIMAKMVNFEI